MRLVRLSAPVELPVDVETAKRRLRIDTSDDDPDLDLLLRAATSAVETHTGRILRRSSFELRLDGWPGCEPLRLPAYPVRQVDEVAYIDKDGVEQTVDDADWMFFSTADGAHLRFVSGFNAPTLHERGRDVALVRFDAGYDIGDESGSGDDPELIRPPALDLALLFLVGHWYANRESVINAQNYDVPQTFTFLANQLRIFR